MRLINVESLELQEFFGDDIPKYAILSHTWGPEEVSYQDWRDIGRASEKAGYGKIRGACRQAGRLGHKWLWVDTNCIDKTSSAELSEAINSMFAWYAKAETCLAYLEDVPTAGGEKGLVLAAQFDASQWFTRGWTLQELLAPEEVIFYARDWAKIGSRGGTLAKRIAAVTGIDEQHLTDKYGKSRVDAASATAAKKMSWVSRRATTREEDIAYCMLGLFEINMPLLYGEGMKAFTRLQEEIIKVSTDHTLFCWEWNDSVQGDWKGFLAPNPQVFQHCNDKDFRPLARETSIYQMTNAGLSIRLPVMYTHSLHGYVALLDVVEASTSGKNTVGIHCVLVNGSRDRNGTLCVDRVPLPSCPIIVADAGLWRSTAQTPLLVKRGPWPRRLPKWSVRTSAPDDSGRFGIFPMLQSADLYKNWNKGAGNEHVHWNLLKANIIWLDMEDFDSTTLGTAFVNTFIDGTGNLLPAGQKRARAAICVAVVIQEPRGPVWVSWVVPSPNETCDRDGLKQEIKEALQNGQWARFEMNARRNLLNLRLIFGPPMPGFGGAVVRPLAIARVATAEGGGTNSSARIPYQIT
ncbi:hypothetical protein EsH8_II_000350 [Colletotrichum jinshuiense]